jgi:putative NADH-flavin reductase
LRILLLLIVYGVILSALLARRGVRAGVPAGPATPPPPPAPAPATPLRILVLGATGGTGREIVARALARGHAVTALVRDPARLGAPDRRLKVLTGDALDAAAVDAAVQGQDAVLCALGHRQFLGASRILSAATANVVVAMERNGVRRLVVETALGIGDSAFRMGLLYTVIVIPLVLPFYFWDKTRQERLVAASTLAWTIVRPGALTDGPATGAFRVGAGAGVGGLVRTHAISRADVAEFMLDALSSDAFVRQAPGVAL